MEQLLASYNDNLGTLPRNDSKSKRLSSTSFRRVRRKVADDIASQLSRSAIPRNIGSFLKEKWADVITQITLKEGDRSPMRSTAVGFIKELAWSIGPKKTPAEQRRLVRLIPQLLSTLRQGLSYINLGERDTETIIAMLETYHIASVRGDTDGLSNSLSRNECVEKSRASNPPTQPPEEPVEINTLIKRLERQLESLAELDVAPAADHNEAKGVKPSGLESFEKMMTDMGFDLVRDHGPRIEDEYTDQVRSLEPGTWVEFRPDDGKRVRGKLAWEGDEYAGFTFVNRRYKVVTERSLYEFAEELRRERASIIDAESIFDKTFFGIKATRL